MFRSGGGTPNVSAAVGTLPVANGGSGATTAVGAASNLSVPYVLAQWTVPVIVASSGSMGNNGAVTGLTALDRTYSSGAWLGLPASAIAAGVPAAAGFYWFVGSSTTAGTVYNSTWAGTGVPTAGVTTAFVTTGPGAFAGSTAEFIAATVTVPVLAANSSMEIDTLWHVTNNANTKTNRIRLGASGAGTGGTAMVANSPASTFAQQDKRIIRNANATNAQLCLQSTATLGIGNSGSGMTTAAIDTSLGTAQLVFTLQHATATDNHGLEGATVVVRF